MLLFCPILLFVNRVAGPNEQKMPNCTSKNAKKLEKMPNKLKQASGWIYLDE